MNQATTLTSQVITGIREQPTPIHGKEKKTKYVQKNQTATRCSLLSSGLQFFHIVTFRRTKVLFRSSSENEQGERK